MKISLLNDFRDLKIDKNGFVKELGTNPIYLKTKEPAIITPNNVLNLIDSYIECRISKEEMLKWCDIVRFSELFEYPDDEEAQEVVARVIDEIQDTEIFSQDITDEKINMWKQMLQKEMNR